MKPRFVITMAAALLVACTSGTGNGGSAGLETPTTSPEGGQTATASPAAGTPTSLLTPGASGAVPVPSAPEGLNAAEKDGLQTALYAEFEAAGRYRQVLSQLGSVRPFSTVAESEQSHIAALESMFSRYSVAIPADPGVSSATYPDLRSACSMGVQDETAVVNAYQSAKATTDRSDLLQVYSNLQAASNDNHLPAFQRC